RPRRGCGRRARSRGRRGDGSGRARGNHMTRSHVVRSVTRVTPLPPHADGSPFAPRVAAFLGAEALSAVGSWATIIAVWGYAAYEYGATPGDVSLFGLAFAVPGVLLGPVAGAVIDRLGPRATL